MGLIGREIVQSRIWLDPNPPEPPSLNYKETFPITIFDAVRREMDNENSQTLTEVVDQIFSELATKQKILPGRPSNYLVTYAGIPGEVGAVAMTQSIPWDPDLWSANKIPSEKAVGEFLKKFGLLDDDGEYPGDGVQPGDSSNSGGTTTNMYKKVLWQNVIGRPIIYNSLGYNEDGVVLQKPITEEFDKIKESVSDIINNVQLSIDGFDDRLSKHLTDYDNPHRVTLEQLGGVSEEAFKFHTEEAENPHHITPGMLGLGDVDNTSDKDKPISDATQKALDELRDLINGMIDDVGDMNFIINIEYDQPSGRLIAHFRNGTTISLSIPIDGLVDEIRFDVDTSELVVYELNGTVKRISIDNLFVRYQGTVSDNITVDITPTDDDGHIWDVHATINHHSITDNEIADNTISERVIADEAVSTDKIKDFSITDMKLNDRSVVGRALFTSDTDNQVLAVISANGDPRWSKITSGMIEEGAINAKHITKHSLTVDVFQEGINFNTVLEDHSITIDKLDIHNSIIGDMIVNNTITIDKLNIYNSITNEYIVDGTLNGDKFEDDVELPGTPSVTEPPPTDSKDNSVATTEWVKEVIEHFTFVESNIGDHEIKGRHLFQSGSSNKALVTYEHGTDPVWGTINNDMLDDSCILGRNIANDTITGDKIKDYSIEQRHLHHRIIDTEYLTESAVTFDKIITSDIPDRVIGVIGSNEHPTYTTVNTHMIELNAITKEHIRDHSITTSKMAYADESYRLLGVGLKGTDPQWMQAMNGMIGNRAIDGRTLFSTSGHNMILGVTTPDTDPAWLKVNSGMIDEKVVKREHIGDGEIWNEHISEKAIESKHIMDWTIQSNNIAPRAITGIELFTSPVPNRVLAVTTMPYSNPAWLQITTDMIEDCAVTRDKIFQSPLPYRVLGASQAGVPPEYIMIDSNYIVDYSIIGGKLERDIALWGTPSLTVPPDPSSNDLSLANTSWVKNTVTEMINNFNPNWIFDIVDSDLVKGLIKDAIEDRSITGSKLFTSKYGGPRVLGVTEAGADPEYILIENELIVDGAVTTNKLQRDIHLLGSPILDVRPESQASDSNGSGNLIPDCQWVLDRIKERGGFADSDASTGGSSAPLGSGSVITDYIKDRAVTGKKLFTSTTANRILAVLGANTDPQWTQITNPMIADKAIDSRNLFSSSEDDRILGVTKAGSNPSYTKLTSGMIGDSVVRNEHIADKTITGEKIAEHSIPISKIQTTAFVDTPLIFDNAVTEQKIHDGSVTNNKVASNAITSDKLAANLELTGTPTVKHTSTYKNRSLRNITISEEAPSGGSDGDIWFQYV